MSILENELVRKYFSCEARECYDRDNRGHMAHAVISAMHEPIKIGDHFLFLGVEGDVREMISIGRPYGNVHPLNLKIPDNLLGPKGCQHENIECTKCAKSFPKPEEKFIGMEKCTHMLRSKSALSGRYYCTDCYQTLDEEVEKKIDGIIGFCNRSRGNVTNSEMRDQLRELVELARE